MINILPVSYLRNSNQPQVRNTSCVCSVADIKEHTICVLPYQHKKLFRLFCGHSRHHGSSQSAYVKRSIDNLLR